jgi:cyclic-di-GMP-binding biofilm dispersal mediator protein
MEITGRSLLVAGASGGLGTPLARELAGRGARLTLVARREDRLRSVPVDAVRVAADLRLPAEAERVVELAVAEHGRLDGVVNAAGVVAFGPAVETSTDTVEELFLSNAFLPIFLFQAALPRLEDGAVLLNVTGVVAEQPVAGMSAYSASKAAISAWLTAVRREVRRRGITVIDARPGHTETGLAGHPIAGTAPSFKPGHDPEVVARRLVQAIVDDEPELLPAAF